MLGHFLGVMLINTLSLGWIWHSSENPAILRISCTVLGHLFIRDFARLDWDLGPFWLFSGYLFIEGPLRPLFLAVFPGAILQTLTEN